MIKHSTELLEKHFDTAFAAPDGIKKLRELILTLAVQGKLVPQDPKEQPASELLQEIEVEKQRLVKEREIKSPKPLLPVMEEEKPYVLPQGWEWVRLRDICHDWGQRIPSGHFTYIDVGAIDNKLGGIAEAQIIGASDAPSRARKVVHLGDVLYSTVRPYLLNIAIVEDEYEPEPIASTAFVVLHSYSGVLNKFVFRYLRSPIFISYVERTQKGVAYPAISDGDFFAGLFPLPPSDEQHRIVGKIDELMAYCDELERLRTVQQGTRLTVHAAAIKKLLGMAKSAQYQRPQAFIAEHFSELYAVKENVAELRKAILQLAVMGKLVPQSPIEPPASELLQEIEAEKQRLVKEGKIKKPKPLSPVMEEEKPYALPRGWEWVRLGELGITQTGTTPPSNDRENYGAHIPFIGPGDIKNNGIDYSGSGLSELGLLKGRLIEKNSVLMVCIGGSIGKHAIAEQNIACNQQINTLTPYSPISDRYLFNIMSSAYFQDAVISRAGGSATPIINKKKWSAIPVPVASESEQRRIISRIDQLMALCDALEQQIDSAAIKKAELLDAVIAQL